MLFISFAILKSNFSFFYFKLVCLNACHSVYSRDQRNCCWRTRTKQPQKFHFFFMNVTNPVRHEILQSLKICQVGSLSGNKYLLKLRSVSITQLKQGTFFLVCMNSFNVNTGYLFHLKVSYLRSLKKIKIYYRKKDD